MNKVKLFECILEMCWSAGGDGDAAFISPNYKQWADEFASFLATKQNTFIRDNQEDYILFYDNQESIWFYHPNTKMHEWTTTDGCIVLKY